MEQHPVASLFGLQEGLLRLLQKQGSGGRPNKGWLLSFWAVMGRTRMSSWSQAELPSAGTRLRVERAHWTSRSLFVFMCKMGLCCEASRDYSSPPPPV